MIQEIDPEFFLRDSGVSITAGAVSGLGIMDFNSEMVVDDMIQVVRATAIVLAEPFKNVRRGDTVIADGVTYRAIMAPKLWADGKHAVLVLDDPVNS